MVACFPRGCKARGGVRLRQGYFTGRKVKKPSAAQVWNQVRMFSGVTVSIERGDSQAAARLAPVSSWRMRWCSGAVRRLKKTVLSWRWTKRWVRWVLMREAMARRRGRSGGSMALLVSEREVVVLAEDADGDFVDGVCEIEECDVGLELEEDLVRRERRRGCAGMRGGAMGRQSATICAHSRRAMSRQRDSWGEVHEGSARRKSTRWRPRSRRVAEVEGCFCR